MSGFVHFAHAPFADQLFQGVLTELPCCSHFATQPSRGKSKAQMRGPRKLLTS